MKWTLLCRDNIFLLPFPKSPPPFPIKWQQKAAASKGQHVGTVQLFRSLPAQPSCSLSCPGQHSTEICSPLIQRCLPTILNSDRFTRGLATFFQNSKLFRISYMVKITLKVYGCFALILGYLYPLTLTQSGITEKPWQRKDRIYV